MEREELLRGQEEGEVEEKTGIQSVALPSLNRLGSLSLLPLSCNVHCSLCVFMRPAYL